jgi:hypothetical protein
MRLLKSESPRYKALPPMHLRKDQFGRLLRLQYGPKIMQECVNQHRPYGDDCWDGGVTELPIREARRKHLNKLRRYWHRTQPKPLDTTKVNAEHPRYPGHYFYPLVGNAALVELPLIDRMKILSDEGNYMVMLANLNDEGQRTDALCACDNARIPTHRRQDAPTIPTLAEHLSASLAEVRATSPNAPSPYGKLYETTPISEEDFVKAWQAPSKA